MLANANDGEWPERRWWLLLVDMFVNKQKIIYILEIQIYQLKETNYTVKRNNKIVVIK